MKAAYFDCQFGAAGDMLVGALIDAGLDKKRWLSEIAKIVLSPDSYKIEIKQVQRRTLAAKKFDVIVSENAPAEFRPALLHTHSGFSPSHGHGHEHGHLHEHTHGSKHSHEHIDNEHHHDHEHGPGLAVAMADVQAVIKNSKISQFAKDFSNRVIERLASCEGPVHGMAPEAIYFHEVGAIDTIIDIIGFSIGYELLGIEKSYVSAVPIGRGHVLTASGYFPVPAPAVALMLAKIKAPTLDYEIDYECLTPTGVAILAELSSSWGVLPRFDQVESIGYGAGTKDSPKHPNVCRVMIGKISG